jgi:hypothetical protein
MEVQHDTGNGQKTELLQGKIPQVEDGGQTLKKTRQVERTMDNATRPAYEFHTP